MSTKRNNRKGEQHFLALYQSGVFEIDFETGKIFSNLSGKKKEVGARQSAGYIHIGAGSFRQGNHYSILAHRFVWIAANGEIPDGYEINHLNGTKTDNRLSNLECVTRSRNTLHAHHELGIEFGIFNRDNTGENNGRAIVTWEKVREMRRLFATGKYTKIELANRFGIKKSQATNILLGYQWIEPD